ncbi:MAG: hypothetical protein HY744_25645 [Deltaproteobacteria bacterium]|nr:hypothetical protein [Deltaproteobacteria bacterium]
MEKFQFSDAARLYAKYAAVVTEMQEAFNENNKAFVEALCAEMQDILPRSRVRSYTTPKFVDLWLGDGPSKDRNDYPYLEFWRNAPEIVTAGRLDLWASAYRIDDKQLDALLRASRSPELAQWVKPASETRANLFAVQVTYPVDDPVAAARPIAAILSAIKAAIEASPAKRRKKRRRS